MKTKLSLIRSALAWGAIAPLSALAGGIQLYEIATPDVGLASAGYAARAADASTLFKNPADMSRLDGSQFQGGLQAAYGSVSFKPNNFTSPGLGNNGGGNAIGWLPGGSLFYTHVLNEKWALGIGTFSYFGIAAQYDDNWVGRYYVQKTALLGMIKSVGFYEHKTNQQKFLRLQLRTVKELMEGKGIERPTSAAAIEETFKKAPESKKKHGHQSQLAL